MKRFLSVLTVCLFFFIQVAYADFDYFALKESLSDDAYFAINENQDAGSSFISPNLFSLSERSFEHKESSDSYYSYFANDWIILDYARAEATPIRRLWVYLSSKDSLDITSLTFTFNNNVCTFSNFFHPAIDITQYDNGDYLQSICLIMGNKSTEFHNAILQYMYSQGNSSLDGVMNLPKMKMTLHGKEDIEVELPNSFFIDFAITDMILSEEDYADAMNMSDIPTTFNIKTKAEAEDSNILLLGKKAEFAIKMNGSYVYNTPESDLTGYETTDKWMFDHEESMACVVHSYTESAYIEYFSTDDNSDLSSWALIKRCIELKMKENALYFDESINYHRDGAKLVFTFVVNRGASIGYTANTFIVLKNGVVCISALSDNEDSAVSFVAEIANSIVTVKGNGFID